jgi:hypothetical protein
VRGTGAPVVLTGRVGYPDNDGSGRTRRRVLRTAAGSAIGVAGTAALAGCGLFDSDPEPPPPPDPAQPVLDGAWALAAAYDRVIAAQPDLAVRLTPMVDAHRAHAAELARVIGAQPTASAAAGPAPSEAPPVGTAAAAVTSLRTAEQAAQKTATALCRTAAPGRAVLIGTIAAARATHAEALRGAA